MNTMARGYARKVRSAAFVICMVAALFGCEMGDPALDAESSLEQVEGELKAKRADKLETNTKPTVSLEDAVVTQPDYETCVAGCMDAGGTFKSCHKTCTDTFPIHYQSCMDLCMPALQSFYQCHKHCNPPKPAPVEKKPALISYKSSYSLETQSFDAGGPDYKAMAIDFDASGVTDENADDDDEGDTDDPEVVPEEPELTPYGSCMYWCQWDGGTWQSCHKTCKKLVKKKPVSAQLLAK